MATHRSNILFVDTGAFYARYVIRDQHHETAGKLWQRVRKEAIPCATTNFVLSELITLLAYRFGSEAALTAAREIYNSQAIGLIHITLEEELKGLEWIERFSDQKISMTDAASFAVMEAKRLATAFTFDHQFEIAGFQRFQ